MPLTAKSLIGALVCLACLLNPLAAAPGTARAQGGLVMAQTGPGLQIKDEDRPSCQQGKKTREFGWKVVRFGVSTLQFLIGLLIIPIGLFLVCIGAVLEAVEWVAC